MKYQKYLTEEKIKCELCPRECVLNKGQSGFCRVRKNTGENLTLETFGYNTGLSIDPIEKKPLYQFYPGTSVLSFGTLGCNMGCLFCQNYHMSKSKADIKSQMKCSPELIVETAKRYNCKSVAFTYNEPVIFFEYAIETAKLCRENNIKTVAVTSGFMNEEPAKEFYQYIDAANIDLKGYTEDFYKKHCLAKIEPVLKTINIAKNFHNCHVELTTLLIEGLNDDETGIKKGCEIIKDVAGDNTPLHFSAFFPRYKYSNKKPTGMETLIKAYDIAKDSGLKYVYTGNLATEETSSTYCPKCGNALIVRDGYNIKEINLDKNRCKYCGTEIYGQY